MEMYVVFFFLCEEQTESDDEGKKKVGHTVSTVFVEMICASMLIKWHQ